MLQSMGSCVCEESDTTWLLNKCGNHPGVQRRAEIESDVTRSTGSVPIPWQSEVSTVGSSASPQSGGGAAPRTERDGEAGGSLWWADWGGGLGRVQELAGRGEEAYLDDSGEAWLGNGQQLEARGG